MARPQSRASAPDRRAAGARRVCRAGQRPGRPVEIGMSGMSRAILADPDYQRLKLRVLAATGLAYFADKDEAFAERLQRRLAVRGVGGLHAYLALLEAERFRGAEMDA